MLKNQLVIQIEFLELELYVVVFLLTGAWGLNTLQVGVVKPFVVVEGGGDVEVRFVKEFCVAYIH